MTWYEAFFVGMAGGIFWGGLVGLVWLVTDR